MSDNNISDKVSVPVPTTQETNPLLHKLTPTQFEASVRFYEADHKLTTEDRKAIATDLQSIILKTAFISYGSAASGFALPTLYNNFRPAKVASKTKPMIHKPFLSFIIGLTTMMLVNQQTMKYQFNKQINSLQEANYQKQCDVWKSMDYHQASLFYLYYRKAAENPSYIISDPRTYTEKTRHQVHYNPVANREQHFTNALGIGHDGDRTSSLSHWERIRLANGFGITESTSDKQLVGASSFKPQDEQSANIEGSSTPKSAWDAIRENSKK